MSTAELDELLDKLQNHYLYFGSALLETLIITDFHSFIFQSDVDIFGMENEIQNGVNDSTNIISMILLFYFGNELEEESDQLFIESIVECYNGDFIIFRMVVNQVLDHLFINAVYSEFRTDKKVDFGTRHNRKQQFSNDLDEFTLLTVMGTIDQIGEESQ